MDHAFGLNNGHFSPPVAEEQVGAVHLPNLLKIKTRPVSSPEAGVGGHLEAPFGQQ